MKYIRCGLGESVREELFDLSRDPHEQDNMIGRADQKVLRQMRYELDSRFAVVTNECVRAECID